VALLWLGDYAESDRRSCEVAVDLL
jgi:hypothetical protein